jgi:hypothetical protein
MSKWSELDHLSATAQAYQKRSRAASIAVFVELVMPRLIDTAKVCGYALGQHGSQARDLDIIAIPWTDKARDADELVSRLCATMRETTGWGHRSGSDWTAKPHGRRACTIIGDSEVNVDLSVMPLQPKEQSDGE